jgi:hypothetical protein
MKTPLKPGLDDEIYEVEERISRRRAAIPRVARATGQSALQALASPMGLAAAALLGFLAGGGLRNKPEVKIVERRKPQEAGKGIAIGSLLMSGAIALIKAQFGSPVQMAQVVLAKLQQKSAGKTSPRADIRPARRVAG